MRLTFHLAGINNQNFLMRDDQTGSYWQQISGVAISGPLKGRRLALVSSDELTFHVWQSEEPGGTVLNDVPAYASDYAPRDWDTRMEKAAAKRYRGQKGIQPLTLMLGIRAGGASRAFPYDAVVASKLVQDSVGADPVMLVLGPDGKSVRAFRRRIPGRAGIPEFYWRSPGLLMDAATGSQWNFQGCAVSGPARGACLEHLECIRDFWFDWKNYNPATTVYTLARR